VLNDADCYFYGLSLQTNMQDFRETEKIVIKRFRDFIWLYERLMECYKGAIIPSLPEKNAVGAIFRHPY
jgi:sorting nexin-1/2